MRAVIYARYSCDNQREESIEGQLRECREFAVRKGYTLVGSYIDRAVSAKTDNRPEFQRMVKESSGGLFDVVIVWKLDRFARNRYDSAHYKAVLRKNGVKVISATEAISEGAEGIILESVLEGYAEYYSAELSEKVIRGMTENALKCQYNGGYIPVGYKIDENKHYQIDELTAPFVREAFLMYVNGKQVKDIVKFLDDNEVRSSQGNKISKTAVTAILQNRKYIGEYSYRDVVVPDGMPAIISKELFALAMDRLEKNRYAPSTYKADERYLLTSKLMCGDCGALMVGEGGTSGSGKVYHYYKCVTAKKKGGCHRKAIRKNAIEELVMRKTVQSVFECNAMDGLVEHLMMWQAKENTVVPLLQRELAEVEKSLENMARAIEQGIINPTTKKHMDDLTAQKTDLEVKIAREEIQAQILTREQVEFWLSKMVTLNLANQDNKQRIIDTFVNSIYVHDDRVIINFNCREESEVVPLQLSQNCSFLRGLGEPTNCYQKDIMPTNGGTKPFVGINLVKKEMSVRRYFRHKNGLEPSHVKFSGPFLYMSHNAPVRGLSVMRGQSWALFCCPKMLPKRFLGDLNPFSNKIFTVEFGQNDEIEKRKEVDQQIMYHIKVNGVTLRAAVENRSPTDIDLYKELANAIILQAVEDYRKWTKEYSGSHDDRKLRKGIVELKEFFRSEWFSLLTELDGEQLLLRLKAELEEQGHYVF